MVGKNMRPLLCPKKACAGGMGVVFRARDDTLHRDRSTQAAHDQQSHHAESRERVSSLSACRLRFESSNLHLYESWRVDGRPYIAMDSS